MGKFRDIASIVVICLLAVVLLASSAQARPASVQLQEGLYAEEIEGDLDAAINWIVQATSEPTDPNGKAIGAGQPASDRRISHP